ncbi:hypothetical protein Sste5346_003786 [Sporothrix stenoceras]|uniref:Uncharacterized protein n=1 Tax=Sporothrix stenoceras TaxID=5173 RepID=A0ABR3ZEI3_9PEZI
MRINTFFRQNSFSSRSSTSSRAPSISDHENDNAITPIEREEYTQEKPKQQHVEFHAQKPAASSKPAELDNAVLWHRMLNLQRRYHCYNSARMSAALEDDYLAAVVPPRACLDLLNDSIASAQLCEEARGEVVALLVHVPERSRSRGGSYADIGVAKTTAH